MSSNLKKNNDDLSEQINCLKKFAQDQAHSILDDTECYNSLISIGYIVIYDQDHDCDIFVQQRFDQVISNYFNEIFKIRTEIDFHTKLGENLARTAVDRNEILAQTYNFVFAITNRIFIGSVEFCTLFVKNDGLRLFLQFLKDEDFLNKNNEAKIIDSGDPMVISDDLTLLLTNLVSRTCDEQNDIWKSLNVTEILFKICEINPTTRLNSYYTLAYLLDDKQIEKLFEQNKMKSILDALLSLLIKASVNFKENLFDRMTHELNFKGKPIKYEVHLVKRDNANFFFISEVLQVLYKLSVNDLIKQAIYFDDNVKDCFKIFFEKGNS